MIHPRAGRTAKNEDLIDLPLIINQYYTLIPDVTNSGQKVSFGTSGHRGTPSDKSFNQRHIWAITQAVVDYRKKANITGVLYLGMDTHALSKSAYISAIEVLAANLVPIIVQNNHSFTPTPVISYFVVNANRNNKDNLVDALIITPSHNPPQDGGIKYNTPDGGPANSEVTSWIEKRANHYLEKNFDDIKKIPYELALATKLVQEKDLITPYVKDLNKIINMDAIATSKIKLGVDPLGGSGIYYWKVISTCYGIKIKVVNPRVDPYFKFMPLDKDGKIRMDCSSPYAMANLVKLQNRFDLAFGNDPDYDRHGIVCPNYGLMEPNHFLAVAIDYLLTHRPLWSKDLAIGKTIVSSNIIDKIVAKHNRRLFEVPVGFKWFVAGLADGTLAFGGEESAGATFLCKDGTTWCTDKDGFILNLLAAEILAVTGLNPAQYYQHLERTYGKSYYKRVDLPIDPKLKSKFALLTPTSIKQTHIAKDKIVEVITTTKNGDKIGGIKVIMERSWFATRPSGTEPLYKIYAQSEINSEHLATLLHEAQNLLLETLKSL